MRRVAAGLQVCLWGTVRMLNLWRDVRFGLRMLGRNKGFTAIAILALALGIGPNVAIFSIIWGTFLSPYPYPHANRMVVVWSHYKGKRAGTSANEYAAWAAGSNAFEELTFGSWKRLHLTSREHGEDPYPGHYESPGYLKIYDTHMAMGRELRAGDAEPGRDHVVILTHRLWETRFHSDRSILGKSILIDNQAYTVIGVIAPGPINRFPGQEFIVPLPLNPKIRNTLWGNVEGRLKPGVSLAQAQAQIAAIDHRWQLRHNHAKASAWSVDVVHYRNAWMNQNLERNLWLLLASVGLVLLIACSNVANLLLARGSSRQQELALRAAMGATRLQIVAQLLTESLTLAGIGGAIGIGMGWGILKFSMAMLPLAQLTSEAVVRLNLPVLYFAVGITLLCGILFGCAPAWQAAHNDLNETLKQGSRSISGGGRNRTQSVLVVLEFALALTLLGGAGMTMQSFWSLSHVNLGINPEHLITGTLQPSAHGGSGASNGGAGSAQAIVARDRPLLEKLRALPGVDDAALSTTLPLDGHNAMPFSIVGRAYDSQNFPVADFELVTPSFLRTFGASMARGRFLIASDTLSTSRVAVVNESFARRYFAHVNPLAQSVSFKVPEPGKTEGPSVSFQVVGVYHDILNSGTLTGSAVPQVLVSLWQFPWPTVAFGARTAVDPGVVGREIRSAVATSASGMKVADVSSMRAMISQELILPRFSTVLFGGFAAVALLLAAMGIYGVMSFTVAQRTHEVGVRMALGAEKREVVAMMVRSGLRLALPGMAVGLIGVFLVGRVLQSTLYGVGAVDLVGVLIVAALLFGVALMACWVPARRSARVDPMVVLREE